MYTSTHSYCETLEFTWIRLHPTQYCEVHSALFHSVFASPFSSDVKLDSYFHNIFIYLLISRMSKHHFRIVNLC